MIEVRNVVKTFGEVRALDGLSMTVPTGAVSWLSRPLKSSVMAFLQPMNRLSLITASTTGA